MMKKDVSSSNKTIIALIIILLILIALPFLSSNLFLAELTASTPYSTPANAIPAGSDIVINYKWIAPTNVGSYIYDLKEFKILISGHEYISSTKQYVDYKDSTNWFRTTPGATTQGSFNFKAPYIQPSSIPRADHYLLRVQHQTIGEPGVFMTVPGEEVTLLVYIKDGIAIPTQYTLIVYILDENSAPLSNAKVSLDDGTNALTNTQGYVQFTKNGMFNIAVTKDGYVTGIKNSVALTSQDQEVAIKLTKISPVIVETETPTPTLPPEETIDFTFTDDDNNPISDVEVNINGEEHFSNDSGQVSVIASDDDVIVALKDDYNRLVGTYDSNTDVNAQLSDEGGEFFVTAELENNNPFFNPFGLFGAYSIIHFIVIFIIAVIILFLVVKR